MTHAFRDFISYAWLLVANAYGSLREVFYDLLMSGAVWVVADTVNYYHQGRVVASAKSSDSAWSELIPSAIVLAALFIIRLLVIAPFRMHQAQEEKARTILTEKEALQSELQEARTPQLQFAIREGDRRYIRVNEPETPVGPRTSSAYFSIENLPGQTQSVEEVVVVLKDILGQAYGPTSIRDVKMLFEGQLDWRPITIHPGERKFVRVVSCASRPGRETEMAFSHFGIDGKTGQTIRLSTNLPHYTIKIHVTARNTPLLSRNLRFGHRNGIVFLEEAG